MHMDCGVMTALTERLLSLQREKWLCTLHACRCRVKQPWAEMLAPNSGQSVPFLLLMLETLAIVGVACNTVFVLQSSSALVYSVVYIWRLNKLACLPSMLLTGVDALTVMVLPRVACMHHDPRLSYTRWQVSSCWC